MSGSHTVPASFLLAWSGRVASLSLRTFGRWAVTSQIGAQRNALVASTALARRRREHDDVEQFLGSVQSCSDFAGDA
jgi:hypothetical protein